MGRKFDLGNGDVPACLLIPVEIQAVLRRTVGDYR
jgi:hypothetical protein